MYAREAVSTKGRKKYFHAIYSAYSPVSADSPRPNPNPSAILLTLLQLYQKNAGKKFLRFIPAANHTHVDEVTTCIGMLEKDKSYPTLIEVFKELSKIKIINPNGALEKLLGMYFSVFPDYQDKITNENLSAAIKTFQSINLWDECINKFLDDFTQHYRDKPDNIEHEQLATVSAVIAHDKADQYADILLTLLNQKHVEARPGLCHGWVAIALGALADKLSPNKKKLVVTRLTACLTATNAGLATVGVCSALADLTADAQTLTVVALHLSRYTQNELRGLLDLFDDHHRNTIALYVPKIFHTLAKLQQYLEAPTKAKIVDLCIEPAHLYPFRHGINALRHWQSTLQTTYMCTRLVPQFSFTELVTTFGDFISQHDPDPDHAFHSRYQDTLAIAKKALLSTILNNTNLETWIKFLATDQSVDEQLKSDILATLAAKLRSCDKSTPIERQISLHKALAFGKEWCNPQGKINIATLFANIVKNNELCKEVRFSAACRASESADLLKAPDLYVVRDTLLSMLDTAESHIAASALRALAEQADPNKLPELMTRLMTYQTPHAMLLLAEINMIYQQKNVTLENNTKLTR